MNKLQRQQQSAKIRLAAKHADHINKAIRNSVNVRQLCQDFFAHHNTAQISTQDARTWVKLHVQPSIENINKTLTSLYVESYLLGKDIGLSAIVRATITKAPSLTDIRSVQAVDWANWKPGNRAAAALVNPPNALRTLLESRSLIVNGISTTTMDRIGTQIAYALDNGLSARGVTPAIAELLATASPERTDYLIQQGINEVTAMLRDPERALMIAQTEMSRAANIASREMYVDSGVEQVEWLTADPCDLCQDNEDASPIGIDEVFPSDDTEPPAHPNCVCSLAPYIVDFKNPVEDEISAEADVTNEEVDYSNLEPVTDFQDVMSVMNQQTEAGLMLNEQELYSVTRYMDGSGVYSSANTYLREGVWSVHDTAEKRELALQVIKDLSAVISRAPALENDMLAYRGIWGQKQTQFFTSLKPGDTFTDKGFVSTSLNQTVAKDFARYEKANGGVLMEIVNPAGTEGVFPLATRVEINETYAHAISENEWLLPKDTTFRVVSVEDRLIKVVVE